MIVEDHEESQPEAGNAAAHYRLGGTLSSQEKLEDAIVAYREAVRLDPQLG